MLIWCFEEMTARSDPSSIIVASNGRRHVLSSCRTTGDAVLTSKTTIREELRHRMICPLTEKLNRNASPCGDAVEELMEVEISLMSVLRGRRSTSNVFRRISSTNLHLSDSRLSEYNPRSGVRT